MKTLRILLACSFYSIAQACWFPTSISAADVDQTHERSGLLKLGTSKSGSKSTFFAADLSGLVNHKLDWLLKPPQGKCTLGDIPFLIAPQENAVFATETETKATVPVHLAGVKMVNLIIAGNYVASCRKNTAVGEIWLNYADGTKTIVPLRAQVNLRENWAYADEEISLTPLDGSKPQSVLVEDQVRTNGKRDPKAKAYLDLLAIPAPTPEKLLESIAIVDFSTGFPSIQISAITLETEKQPKISKPGKPHAATKETDKSDSKSNITLHRKVSQPGNVAADADDTKLVQKLVSESVPLFQQGKIQEARALCASTLNSMPKGKQSRLCALYLLSMINLKYSDNPQLTIATCDEGTAEANDLLLTNRLNRTAEAMHEYRTLFAWYKAQALYRLKRYNEAYTSIQLVRFALAHEVMLPSEPMLAQRALLLQANAAADAGNISGATQLLDTWLDKLEDSSDDSPTGAQTIGKIVENFETPWLDNICKFAEDNGVSTNKLSTVLRAMAKKSDTDDEKLKLLELAGMNHQEHDELFDLLAFQRKVCGAADSRSIDTLKRIVNRNAGDYLPRTIDTLREAVTADGTNRLRGAQLNYCELSLINLNLKRLDSTNPEQSELLKIARALDTAESAVLTEGQSELIPTLLDSRFKLIRLADNLKGEGIDKSIATDAKAKARELCRQLLSKEMTWANASALSEAADDLDSTDDKELIGQIRKQIIVKSNGQRKLAMIEIHKLLDRGIRYASLPGTDLLKADLPLPDDEAELKICSQIAVAWLGQSENKGKVPYDLSQILTDYQKKKDLSSNEREILIETAVLVAALASGWDDAPILSAVAALKTEDAQTIAKFQAALAEVSMLKTPAVSVALFESALSRYGVSITSDVYLRLLSRLAIIWARGEAAAEKCSKPVVAEIRQKREDVLSYVQSDEQTDLLRQLWQLASNKEDAAKLHCRYIVHLEGSRPLGTAAMLRLTQMNPYKPEQRFVEWHRFMMPDDERAYTTLILNELIESFLLSPTEEMTVNQIIAKNYSKLNQLKEAQVSYNKVIQGLPRDPDHWQEEVQLLQDAASFYGDKNPLGKKESLAQATICAERALQILRSHGEGESNTAATILFDLGSDNNGHGEFAESNTLLTRAMAIWQKLLPADDHNLSMIYRLKAFNATGLKNPSEAISLMEKALKINEERYAHQRENGSWTVGMSQAYDVTRFEGVWGKKATALDVGVREEELAGFIMRGSGGAAAALPHLLRAYEFGEKSGNPILIKRALSRICESSITAHDWPSARKYLEIQCKKIASDHSDPFDPGPSFLFERAYFNNYIREKYLKDQVTSNSCREVVDLLMAKKFKEAARSVQSWDKGSQNAATLWVQADATFTSSPDQARSIYRQARELLSTTTGVAPDVLTAIDISIADCAPKPTETILSLCTLLENSFASNQDVVNSECLLHLAVALRRYSLFFLPKDECMIESQKIVHAAHKKKTQMDDKTTRLAVNQLLCSVELHMASAYVNDTNSRVLSKSNDEALKLIETICSELKPEEAFNVALQTAQLRRSACDYPGAVQALDAVSSSSVTLQASPDALLAMAQIYLEQRESERALELSAAAVKKMSDKPRQNWADALSAYAAAATTCGKAPSAIVELKALYEKLEQGNAKDQAKLPLALVLSQLLLTDGQIDEATKFSRRAVWYSGMRFDYNEKNELEQIGGWSERETPMKYRALINSALTNIANNDWKSAEEIVRKLGYDYTHARSVNFLDRLLIKNVVARVQYVTGKKEEAIATSIESAEYLSSHLFTAMSKLSFAEQCALSSVCEEQAGELLGICRDSEDFPKAYSFILKWKGMLFEILRQHSQLQAGVKNNPENAELIRELICIQRKLAQFNDSNQKESATKLTARKEQIQRELASKVRWGGVDDLIERETTRSVTNLLQPDEGFVDCMSYLPPDGKALRYGVIVFGHDGDFQFVDIGSEEEVNRSIKQLLAVASSPDTAWDTSTERNASMLGGAPKVTSEGDVAQAQAFINRLHKELGSRVEKYGRLWVCPEDDIALIPWSLVLNEKPISVIDNVREFVKLRRQQSAQQSADTRAVLMGGLEFAHLKSLPNTISEIDKIRDAAKKKFTDTVIFDKSAASKDRVIEALADASYVHLATHGFFWHENENNAMPEPVIANATSADSTAPSVGSAVASKTAAGTTAAESPPAPVKPAVSKLSIAKGRSSAKRPLPFKRSMDAIHGAGQRNPLANSGLVLSSLNGEDSFLTAEEVLSVDLHKCRLVTLSACETGLGAMAGGQGVLGLRTAIMAAGADSIVMSLWNVDDASTSFLMQRFYSHLWKEKKSVANSLFLAQAETRKQKRWSSPYYWAGWIVGGKAW